jgi:effector-binding domain-containing protein
MFFLIIVIIFFLLWSLWGYFSSRVEQMNYIVTKKMQGYEIREYPSHIVAQANIKGTYDEALSLGFRVVAGYIFGGNTKKENISMTAPVTSQKEISEKISMTAPVLATMQGDSHLISFGMPSSYTLETLPLPSDPRVKIVSVPAKEFAVLRFSSPRSQARSKVMESRLLGYLERDGIMHTGSPIYAGYNPPWTPPWMIRNEIMVEILK